MTPRGAGRDAPALAAAFLAAAMWGAVPVGTRFLVDGAAQRIDPTLLVALRLGLSALVLSPVLLHARPWAWPRADQKLTLLAAALGVIGYNLPVAIGQVAASAGSAALVIATEPLWILLLWSLKRRARPTGAQFGGVGIGTLGIAVLAGPAIAGEGIGQGLTWVLLGAFCWSAYCVAVVPLVQRHGTLPVTASTVSVGSLPLLLLASPTFPRVSRLGADDMGIIILLAIGSTVFATLAWNFAVARLPGPVSGQFLFCIPAVGLVAGHYLLGEDLTGRTWLALCCILCGLWLGRPRSGT